MSDEVLVHLTEREAETLISSLRTAANSYEGSGYTGFATRTKAIEAKVMDAYEGALTGGGPPDG